MKYSVINKRLDPGFVPDTGKYAGHLREMISCRTVSDAQLHNGDEFKKFDAQLEKFYPHLFFFAEKIHLGESTFLRLKGKNSDSPLVLMSHKDVVAEGKKKWKSPPYEGRIVDGRLYGRGSFDCKGSLCALLEALEGLICEQFVFSRDIYILSTATEETGGDDAPKAVEYFREKGIVPGLVIDEGGAVLSNPFPSQYKRFAMFGAVERSTCRFIFDFPTAEKKKTFERKMKSLRAGKYDIYPETAGLIKGLSSYLSFPLSALLKVLDRHSAAACSVLTHCGSDARSFCGAVGGFSEPDEYSRNMLEEKYGALNYPVRAFGSGNYYVKIDDVAAEIERIGLSLGGKIIEKYCRETEMPVSANSVGFRFLSDTAAAVYDNIAALPYPVMGRTDSRYFVGFADDVIRCAPIEITLSQMMKFHCPDENINAAALGPAVAFYREAVKRYCLE